MLGATIGEGWMKERIVCHWIVGTCQTVVNSCRFLSRLLLQLSGGVTLFCCSKSCRLEAAEGVFWYPPTVALFLCLLRFPWHLFFVCAIVPHSYALPARKISDQF